MGLYTLHAKHVTILTVPSEIQSKQYKVMQLPSFCDTSQETVTITSNMQPLQLQC